MDIIQALKKLRQDIQSWVTLNVRNVLGKINEHTSDTNTHITSEDRTNWDAKSDFSGDYNDLTNAPSISEDMTDGVIYADKDGNIIARVDDDGLKTTAISAGEIRLGTQSLVVETWTFTLEDGTTVTKRVVIG